MSLFPDTQNCGLRMRRECREPFPRHRLQRKPLVGDPGMHHGTSVMHVLRCMLGSLTHSGGENVPGIPGAYASRNFMYLVRGPWRAFRQYFPQDSESDISAAHSIVHYLWIRVDIYTGIRPQCLHMWRLLHRVRNCTHSHCVHSEFRWILMKYALIWIYVFSTLISHRLSLYTFY